MDDHPGLITGESWPTLTQAATQTGYTREALRLRVRRGRLRAVKGNDGVTRVDPDSLADLPPAAPDDDMTLDDQGVTMDILRSTLDRAMDDLGHARLALDRANEERLVDRGRAERAEARLEAETARMAALEGRLTSAEMALVEARTPWVVRVARGLLGR